MAGFRIRSRSARPAPSPALAGAHLAALKQQVPLLYLILILNSATLAYTHLGVAPTGLVVAPVAVLAAVCLARTVSWLRLDLAALAPGRRVALLRRTNRLTAVLAPSFMLWALSLARYGDQLTTLHVFFFLALTPIGCIFCLMHLRSAALTVALTVTAPAVLFVLHQQGAVLTSIAVNLLLVGGVMLFILFIQSRDFARLANQNEELAALGEQNRLLAVTDALTGLPNRRTFFPALEALVDAAAPGAAPLVAVVDLAGFKRLNEQHGHLVGDRVLAALADRLRAALPASALLARIGGDEFGLALPGDAAAPATLDRALRDALATPVPCQGVPVAVKASAGAARWQAPWTCADLLERVHFALRTAKQDRAGGVTLFSAAHEERLRGQVALEGALRQADLAAELSLVFQPMVDVDHDRTVAFEALARWHSPTLGHVGPDRFITAAERMGLIRTVTKVLLAKLLAAMAGWPAEVAVSFNLSTADVSSPDAVADLEAMIGASGVDPRRLQFEVTETATLDDFERAAAGLARLKALGSTLALDDFGTGYSSLSHVHRLPVDKLKVDRSFTRELASHAAARSIVASIIGLGHGLRLECVVEGVETAAEVLLVRGLGGRVMQGYYFSRPLPQAQVPAYLAAERDRAAAAAPAAHAKAAA